MNETTFSRHNSAKNFTVLNNHFLQDKDLSNKAVGLLARILHLPDDWKINIKGLASTFNCSKDQIQNILKELIKYGYVRRSKVYNKNILSRYHYDISDLPIYDDERQKNRNPENQDNEQNSRNPEKQDNENTPDNKDVTENHRNPDSRYPEKQDDYINTNEVRTKKQITKRKKEIDFEFLDNKFLKFDDRQKRCFNDFVKIGIPYYNAISLASKDDSLLLWFKIKDELKKKKESDSWHWNALDNTLKCRYYAKKLKELRNVG